MRTIRVVEAIDIERSADVVRRQFADVVHHASTGVHRGVTFVVTDDDGSRCRYRQTTRVGPLRLHQDLDLERTDHGPLVNTVTSGQFAGGTISFDVVERGPEGSRVEAVLDAPLNGPGALLAGVLRSTVARAFRRALREDKVDLEQGRYPAPVA